MVAERECSKCKQMYGRTNYLRFPPLWAILDDQAVNTWTLCKRELVQKRERDVKGP